MNFKTTLLASLLMMTTVSLFAQSYSEFRSVPAQASVNSTNPSIQLSWLVDADATAYTIYRRALNANSWGNPISTLGATDSTYTDNNVAVNTIYEYAIKKSSNVTEPFATGGLKLDGYSYISAAIELEAKHSRGVLWILVTEYIDTSINAEVNQLMSDLAGDGWDVYKEVFNSSVTVTEIKRFIDSRKESAHGIGAVYLLGHIPVPYSGTYCQDQDYLYPPDGHNEVDPNSHCGAWAADVYYVCDTIGWTDTDSTTLAKRPENNNAIGDGKFDNNRIPNSATLQLGRVDLSDLDSFPETEAELTARYLTKVHNFKIGTTIPLRKAIIENNFANFGEGFSSASRRDFASHVGYANVESGDLFTSSATKDYMHAYACGAGWYVRCNGVGNTGDFRTKNGAMFNHIFGSFFGDYDIANNFMRASLASPKNGLTITWSGRPKWVTHTLAIGDNYGAVAWRTQNNNSDYDGNFYQGSPHIALLGDPSLRTIMVQPTTSISLKTNADSTSVDVTWDATTENGITGYYVYRSHRPYGGYVLLNQAPTSALSYTDDSPYDGTNWYMVRTEKLTTTFSGSYYNLSIGDRAEINGMKGNAASVNTITQNEFLLYPTLGSTSINVQKETASAQHYVIINNLGIVVKEGTLNSTVSKLDISEFSPGVYYLNVEGATKKFVKT
jgi:hypothetical protein